MTAIKGKTYSLYGGRATTDLYYSRIREITDQLLVICPDEKILLDQVIKAGNTSLIKKLTATNVDRELIEYIKRNLKKAFKVYTTGVSEHLKDIPLKQKFDPIIKTNEEQHHLYMIEIELVNRLYKEAFKESDHKFALIAHCLRDFRPHCSSERDHTESKCMSCTDDCFINLGSRLMKEYDIHPYISVSMDLEILFKNLKSKHKSIGALGIACVPELAQGMRSCIKAGIPPVGIPLDANRCSRWMGHPYESSFSIKELENLLK
jgi:hypothetical protein